MTSFVSPLGRKVGMAHRVTIDRRIIEWRQIYRRFDVGGDNPGAGAMQGHTLGLGDRHNPFGDQTLHLVEPKQRPGECEAVVGELRH